jgi:mannose-6-phosphate isomerase-like protein (cupin superfamily)
VPFVHSHKQNEEVYLILKGSGLFHVDGDEFEVREGHVVRVAPAGARCLKADEHNAMRYICIQTRVGSLQQFSHNDGVRLESMPSWLK